jgi:hypothetical protein
MDAIRIKRIRIDSRNLYVSKWLREIAVPLIEIASVTETKWIKGHPVTIHFKDQSICGESVMFLPKVRLGFWIKHPIVEELKRLSGMGAD